MRTMILGVATAAVFAFSTPAMAQQSGSYQWCAQYDEAGTNCGFATQIQCNEAVSGNGGTCDHNVFAAPDTTVAGSTRVQRRRVRQQRASS